MVESIMTFRSSFENATISALGAMLLFACGSSEDDATSSDASVVDGAFSVNDAFESGQQDHIVADAAVSDAGEQQEVSTDVVEDDAETKVEAALDSDQIDADKTDAVPDSPPESSEPSEVTIGTLTETRLFDVKATSDKYRTLQGGGSDGTYGYFVMMHKTTDKDIHFTQLTKYRIYDGARIATVNFDAIDNKTNQLGHGNDVAFNHDTGKLIVPAWTNDKSIQPDNNQKLLRIIDPDTLNIVATETLDVELTNLCYAKKTYLTFASGKFRTYNAQFKPVSAIPFEITVVEDKYAPTGKRVGQGIDCDEDYVYITRWYPDAKSNVVYVADWKAHLVGAYRYDGPESEHMMHVSGSRMLHGFNTTGVGGDVRRIEKLMYEVGYEPNGGSGSMSNTRVLYGRKTPLRKNAFVLDGKQFVGWAAQRSNDGKWRYRKPDESEDGWYVKGEEPSGWSYYIYKDGAIVLKSASWGLVKMHAQWK